MGKMTLVATLVGALSASPARAEVTIAIHDGLVSLTARDATVQQILTEWARVGQTKIVNGERVPGGPLTLQLTNVPEQQALDIVLRSISGYLAAPRQTFLANASRFDRIVVMPTVATARAATAVPAAGPQPQPRLNFPVPTEEQFEDPARNAVPPNVVQGGAARPPVFNTFPTPERLIPQPDREPNGQAPPVQEQPSSMPTAPPGSSAPGVIIALPSQPGQIVPNPQPQQQQP